VAERETDVAIGGHDFEEDCEHGEGLGDVSMMGGKEDGREGSLPNPPYS